MTNKSPSSYAFPVAANPETVYFLTLPMDKRQKLGYGPSNITDADRAEAAKIIAERAQESQTTAGIENIKPSL